MKILKENLGLLSQIAHNLIDLTSSDSNEGLPAAEGAASESEPSSLMSDLANAFAIFSSTTGSVLDSNQRNTSRFIDENASARQSIDMLENSIDQLLSDQSFREKLQKSIYTRMGTLPPNEMRNYSSSLLSQFRSKYPMAAIQIRIDELNNEIVEAEKTVGQQQQVIKRSVTRIRAKRDELQQVKHKIDKLSDQINGANDILSVIGYASFIIPWTMALKTAVPLMSAVAGTSKLISSIFLESKNKKVKSTFAKMNSVQGSLVAENRLQEKARGVIDSVHARQEYYQGQILWQASQQSDYSYLVKCQEEVKKLELANTELEIAIKERIKERHDKNKVNNQLWIDGKKGKKLSEKERDEANRNEDAACKADVAQLKEKIASNKLAIANKPSEIKNPVAMQVIKKIHDLKVEAERDWGFTLTNKQAEVALAVVNEYTERLEARSPAYHHAMYAKTTIGNFLQIQAFLRNISPETVQYQTMALSSLVGTYDTFRTLSIGVIKYQDAYGLAKKSLEDANVDLAAAGKDQIAITGETIESERKKLLFQVGGRIGLIFKPFINTALCAFQLYAILKGDYDPNPIMTHLNSIHLSLNRSMAELYKANMGILGKLTMVHQSVMEEIHTSTARVQREIANLHHTVSSGFYAVNNHFFQLNQNLQQLRLYVDEAVDRQIMVDVNNQLNLWYGQALNNSKFKDSEKPTPAQFQEIVTEIASSLIGHESQNLPGRVVTVPYNGSALKAEGVQRQLAHLKSHPSWRATGLIGELTVHKDSVNSKPIPSFEMLMIASSLLLLLVSASPGRKKPDGRSLELMCDTDCIQHKVSITLSMLERLVEFIQTLREDADVWRKQVKAVRDAKQKHSDLTQSIESAHQGNLNCQYAKAINKYIDQVSLVEYGSYVKQVNDKCPSNVDVKYFYPKAVALDTLKINGDSRSLMSLLHHVWFDYEDSPTCIPNTMLAFHGNNWAATYCANYSGGKVDRAFFDVNCNVASAVEGLPLINFGSFIVRKIGSLIKDNPAWLTKQLIAPPNDWPNYGITVVYQGMRPPSGFAGEPVDKISIKLNGIEIKNINLGAISMKNSHRTDLYKQTWSEMKYPDDRFSSENNYKNFTDQYKSEFHMMRDGYAHYVTYHSNLLRDRKKSLSALLGAIQKLKDNSNVGTENERSQQINHSLIALKDKLNERFCAVAFAGGEPMSMMTYHHKSKATELLYEALKHGVGRFYGKWDIQEEQPFGTHDNPAIVIRWFFVDKQGEEHLYSTELKLTISKEMRIFHSEPKMNNNDMNLVFDWKDFILRVFIGSENNRYAGVLSNGTIYAHQSVTNCLIPQELAFVGLRLLSWYYDFPIKMSSNYDSQMGLLLYKIAKGEYGHLDEINRKLDNKESAELNLLTQRGWRYTGNPVSINAETENQINDLISTNKSLAQQQLEQVKNASALSALQHSIELQMVLLERMVGFFEEGADIKRKANEITAGSDFMGTNYTNIQTVQATTDKDQKIYQSLLAQHSNLSFFNNNSPINKVQSLIPNTHQLKQTFYRKCGLFSLFAQFYPGYSARELQIMIRSFFSYPPNQGKEWVRRFNEEGGDHLRKGELTLDYIKAICQALFLERNNVPGRPYFDYQVHIIFSGNASVEHYVFGKENNSGEPLPKNAEEGAIAPYLNEKMFHIACNKNWVWEIQSIASPMNSFVRR